VNLTKVNKKTINITNIYINSRVTNAVTVVHHETFLTGKHGKGPKVHANPFVAGLKVSPGGPEIRPVKATSMPLPEKIVPRKSLPSGRVIEKARATGNRPVAVHRDTSVFKPGKQVSALPVRKVAKPKPIKEIPVRERAVPQPQKDLTEKPVVQPKAPVRWHEVPKRDVRPSGQTGISEKPVQPPKVDKGKTPYPGREPVKAPAQKKTIEKPAIDKPPTMPGKGGESPVQQKGKGSPDLQKENKTPPVLPVHVENRRQEEKRQVDNLKANSPAKRIPNVTTEGRVVKNPEPKKGQQLKKQQGNVERTGKKQGEDGEKHGVKERFPRAAG
jgi:hypothetical protein